MTVRSRLVAVVAAGALSPLAAAAATPAPLPSPAVVATPAAAPTRDALSYDDAGMHFRAPDGWTRVDLGVPPETSDASRPIALFVFHPGKYDQREIRVTIEPWDGTLEGFETQKESAVRGGSDGTFIDHRDKTALQNGMPAYLLRSSQPGGSAGFQLRRYDMLVYDLTRGIDVAFVGHAGDFDEAEVRHALATLSVVVYPRTRR